MEPEPEPEPVFVTLGKVIFGMLALYLGYTRCRQTWCNPFQGPVSGILISIVMFVLFIAILRYEKRNSQ
jgi:hypothetical protein